MTTLSAEYFASFPIPENITGWKLVALDCKNNQICTESTEFLMTDFVKDSDLKKFQKQFDTKYFRIIKDLYDFNIFDDSYPIYDLVIPPIEASEITVTLIFQNGAMKKFSQNSNDLPTLFKFIEPMSEKNETIKVTHISKKDRIAIDFKLKSEGVLGVNRSKIAFVEESKSETYSGIVSDGSTWLYVGLFSILAFLMVQSFFKYYPDFVGKGDGVPTP